MEHMHVHLPRVFESAARGEATELDWVMSAPFA